MNVDKFSGLPIETDTSVTLGTAWEAIEVAQEKLLLQNSELAAAVLALKADRKRTQEALHESEERFRFLVESVREYAIFRLAPDGCVVSWNAGATTILGYQAAESIGHHFSCFFTPEDIQSGNPEQDLRTTVAKERVEEDRWYVRSNGTLFWGSGIVTALRDEAGNLLGFSKIVRDMTSHKRAEQKIQEQAALLDVATDAILVQDLNNRILYWNQGAERLYGWKADDVLGKNASELLYKDSLQLEEAQKAVVLQAEWYGELHKVTRTGKEIIVESCWTLVRDEQGGAKSILTADTDITDKKQFEAQFLRAQRLESIGTLASGIAHDLNNILTPILMSVQLLRMKIPDEPSQRLLKILEANAKRGAALVKQVLSFARGVEGKRITLQVRHLILEIKQITTETFPKSIEISTNIPQNLWTVCGDATQLHQVLMNLCVNARDAMPNGGRLNICAENLLVDQNYARINLAARVGSYIVISVTDTGMGVSPEILSKIFEPFFTTKEVGKGTGLGLSTVIGIIKSHKGFVNVYSEVGKGTQFKVYLPAVSGSQQQAEDSELLIGHQEAILVVDDEAPILEITKTT